MVGIAPEFDLCNLDQYAEEYPNMVEIAHGAET